MKKIFIGLLVVAVAAAGVYYLLSKRTGPSPGKVQQELLIGQWKIDSSTMDPSSRVGALLAPKDTSGRLFTYDFESDGRVFRSKDDSIVVDSAFYEWTPENELSFKSSPADTIAEKLPVITLNRDSLVLRAGADSHIYCSRMK